MEDGATVGLNLFIPGSGDKCGDGGCRLELNYSMAGG